MRFSKSKLPAKSQKALSIATCYIRGIGLVFLVLVAIDCSYVLHRSSVMKTWCTAKSALYNSGSSISAAETILLDSTWRWNRSSIPLLRYKRLIHRTAQCERNQR